MDSPHPILLFDGVCNLCNRSMQFVIRHDPPPGRFRFAALQSDAGQHLLQEHNLLTAEPESVVMIDQGRAVVRSTAALRVLRELGFPWSVLYAFIIVPRPIRDAVYRWVARHRYRWFGKRDSCMIPTSDIQSRFLHDV